MSEREKCPYCGKTEHTIFTNGGYWRCSNYGEGRGCGMSGPDDDKDGTKWDALSRAVWGSREEIERLKRELGLWRTGAADWREIADVRTKEIERLKKECRVLRQKYTEKVQEPANTKNTLKIDPDRYAGSTCPETRLYIKETIAKPAPTEYTATVRDMTASKLREQKLLMFRDWILAHAGKEIVVHRSAADISWVSEDGYALPDEWLENIQPVVPEWTPRKGEAVWGKMDTEISWLGIYDGKGIGALSAYHRLITRGMGVEGRIYGWATEIRPIEVS